MLGRTDGLRVMWDRTPFPLTQITGSFAPHSANNIYIVAKTLRGTPRHPADRELRAVHVGSGAAMEKLIDCANREDICGHAGEQYELIAFSCYVGEALREGTERFLANDLLPVLSITPPNARPNGINLPAVQWERPGKGAPLRKAG
jgi:hypothetical protein